MVHIMSYILEPSNLSNYDFLDKYKLFIVDYDGTVLDSMRMWDKLISSFVKEEGIVTNIDVDKVAIKQTNKETLNYLHETFFSDESIEKLEKRLFEYVKKSYVKQSLKPNVLKLLNEFSKRGKIILFSATASHLLNASFEVNKVNQYFSNIYSASDLKTTKLDGSGFELVCSLENSKLSEALVVEDAIYAIEGAKNKNIDVLAIFDYQKSWDKIKNIADYNLDLSQLV